MLMGREGKRIGDVQGMRRELLAADVDVPWS